jgi:hypothetical protein
MAGAKSSLGFGINLFLLMSREKHHLRCSSLKQDAVVGGASFLIGTDAWTVLGKRYFFGMLVPHSWHQ